MKAAELVSYGTWGSAGLELRDVIEPDAPGHREALISVEYSPINKSDMMTIKGIYMWKPQLPAIVGSEGCGIVLQVGADVENVRPGDRVLIPGAKHVWRERLVAPADQLMIVPPHIDAKQAAMLVINPVTAILLLEDFVRLEKGDAIAFNIANSGLGRWLAAVAKDRGIKTIGLVRSQTTTTACDFTVYDAEDIGISTKRLDGLNVRLVLDGVGGAATTRLLRFLRPGGQLVAMANISGRPMEVPTPSLTRDRIKIEGFWLGHRLEALPNGLNKAMSLLSADSTIEQPLAAIYPFEQIKEAVDHAARGGRVLLKLKDDQQPSTRL